MNEIKDKQQYIEKIFRKVAKSFPELKEDDITIIYLSGLPALAGYSSLNRSGTKKEPRVKIGEIFFDYTKEEQEGIMAHEIGHHETMKNKTIQRIKRHNRWNAIHKYHLIHSSRPHWRQRLKQRFILIEMAADNKAAETKYGKNLLQYYKNHISPLSPSHQIVLKNLEEKLREK